MRLASSVVARPIVVHADFAHGRSVVALARREHGHTTVPHRILAVPPGSQVPCSPLRRHLELLKLFAQVFALS